VKSAKQSTGSRTDAGTASLSFAHASPITSTSHLIYYDRLLHSSVVYSQLWPRKHTSNGIGKIYIGVDEIPQHSYIETSAKLPINNTVQLQTPNRTNHSILPPRDQPFYKPPTPVQIPYENNPSTPLSIHSQPLNPTTLSSEYSHSSPHYTYPPNPT
jgi:hypothetical protein